MADSIMNAMPPVMGASPVLFASDAPLAHLPDENEAFLNQLLYKNNRRVYDRAMVMSQDAEWFPFGGRNVPLSEQLSVVSPETAVNRIYYTPTGARLKKGFSIEAHLSSDADAVAERLTLEELVERAMLAHDGGKLRNRKSGRTRVIFVAHNTVAEWSMLADRDQAHVTKYLTAIRKSPVTGVHPIKLRNCRIGKVDLEIFDTRLLAPAGLQSLAKLSSLLGEGEEKLDIPERYKRRMDKLLRDDPELFERYALRDTEVTIKVFFLLQRQLNELAFGRIDRTFKTLGSAAVKGFLYRNDWFGDYRDHLDEGVFGEVRPIIKRAYLGGLNMGCFRGDTGRVDALRDYIFVDIDFANAYANAMARCPKIDLAGEIDIVRAEYEWTDTTERRLLDENLPPTLITLARQAVEQGRDAVEAFLRDLRAVKKSRAKGLNRRWKLQLKQVRQLRHRRNRHHARLLRDALLVPNNRHLDRWVEQVDSGQLAGEIPGFAKVRFSFPPATMFPCLPVKKPPFGLIYAIAGETVVPAVELVQAVKAGARVEVFWSIELPVEAGTSLYFYEHLQQLVAMRADAKKQAATSPEAAAREQLLKEFINAFYGKTAQGLNYRTMHNPATGEYFPLAPSELTEPSVAALVTAQVRAALSATLLAIDGYNRSRPDERPIIVISATTDGLLIGIPCSPDYSLIDEYFDIPSSENLEICKPPRMKKGIDLRTFLAGFGHSGLLDAFYNYAPLQNLRTMRQKLTGQDDFLEIKHMADRVVSVKTRGQIGMIGYAGREYCSLIARYGHKIPLSLIYDDPEVYSGIMKGDRNTADAEWLFERIEHAVSASEIESYPFLNLTSFKSILESKGTLDLVNNVALLRTNSDWDWKRRFERDESGNLSPFSLPHETVSSMLRYRRQADAIRKGGQNATPELVEHRLKVKGRGVRARNGQAAMLTRLFLRGLVQECYGVSLKMPEAEIAARVDGVWLDMDVKPAKTWTRSDINNARRGKWEVNVLIHNPGHDRLLEALCTAFRVNATTVRQQLFAGDIVAKSTALLAQGVAQAILAGPGLCIEPFVTLHREGALPGRSALAERLAPHLDGPLQVESQTFPMHVPAGDRPMLQRLFIQAGLSAAEARQCAQCLSPIDDRKRKPRRNPSQTKCLELFVTALHQPDIHPQEVKAGDVFKRLKRFGLSKRDYYLARSKTLAARSLMATGANRRQIEQMSTALKLDAGKFLQALLEDA